MEELLKTIHSDVKDIRATTVELVKQGAIHNQLLQIHEQRSLTLKAELEQRVKPLESDYEFRRKLYVLVMGTSGVLAIASLLMSVLIYAKK